MKNIGIVLPISDGVSINARYLEYFSKYGNLQFINPLDETVYNLDLLVLPGGADVDTSRYNAKPSFFTGKPNHYVEWFDVNILPKYIENDTPIFGICRGFQSLIVAFGGTLTQHMYVPVSEPRNRVVEALDFTGRMQPSKDIQLFCNKFPATKKDNKFMVNSIHHQGVYDFNIIDTDIRVLATSQDYGNIEAISIENRPILAVQYHPEEINCDYTELLILNLLNVKSTIITSIFN